MRRFALALPLLCACAAPLPSERVHRSALLGPEPEALTPPSSDDTDRPSTPTRAPRDSMDRALAHVRGEAVARGAAAQVGTRAGHDCSTFVREIYRQQGVDLFEGGGGDSGVRMLWRLADSRGAIHRRPRPDPGDLVFFDDTHDRNHDGRRNDPLTHVGIVIRTEQDGTVVFAHRIDRGVVLGRMNLADPGVRTIGGRVVNDWLREGETGPRLSGSLFAGFATLAGS